MVSITHTQHYIIFSDKGVDVGSPSHTIQSFYQASNTFISQSTACVSMCNKQKNHSTVPNGMVYSLQQQQCRVHGACWLDIVSQDHKQDCAARGKCVGLTHHHSTEGDTFQRKHEPSRTYQATHHHPTLRYILYATHFQNWCCKLSTW